MSPGKPKQASRPLTRKDVEKAAMDAAKMRADAKAKVGAIVKRMLPEGHVRGLYWSAPDPRRPEDKGANLSVDLLSGAWQNFHTGTRGADAGSNHHRPASIPKG
jgi:hypothetical protein